MFIKVKLKDANKIAWDKETGTVIKGSEVFEVQLTQFIKQKIEEGVLIKVEESEKLKDESELKTSSKTSKSKNKG